VKRGDDVVPKITDILAKRGAQEHLFFVLKPQIDRSETE
jgi:hypothetical protein